MTDDKAKGQPETMTDTTQPQPRGRAPCRWCGKLYDEHLDDARLAARTHTPRVPCILARRHFAPVDAGSHVGDPLPLSAAADHWQRVVIESPFAGDSDAAIGRNQRYLRACMRDCLLRGEAPYASHALYTQPGVLSDRVLAERELGIAAGFAWRESAAKTVVYADLGISGGMQQGMAHALRIGQPVEARLLGDDWEAKHAERLKVTG